MSEWKEYKIGEISSLLKDGTHGTHKDVSDGVPLLSAKDIVNNKIDIPEDTRLISDKDYDSIHRSYNIREDDVLLTLVGSVGRAAVVPIQTPKFTIQRSVGVIRTNGLVDPKYFYYFITASAFQRQLINSINASAQGGVYLGTLSKLTVEAPPLPVQRKIALILSTIDGQIEKTEAIIAKYQAVKQGMLQELFTRGIDVQTGQLRRLDEQGSQHNREYIFPLEWACVRLRDYLLKIEQGWSPNCDDAVALINEWGILKTTAVKWEGYNGQENKKLPATLKPRKEYEVKEEDVLVTRAGPNSRVGVVAFVEKTRRHLIFSDKIYRLSPSVDILPAFLSFALSSNYTQSHLSMFKTGMAESQTNISQSIIKALEILLPSVDEQRLIIDKITSINGLIDSEKRNFSKLQLLKQGLMQDLLSGKVAVD